MLFSSLFNIFFSKFLLSSSCLCPSQISISIFLFQDYLSLSLSLSASLAALANPQEPAFSPISCLFHYLQILPASHPQSLFLHGYIDTVSTVPKGPHLSLLPLQLLLFNYHVYIFYFIKNLETALLFMLFNCFFDSDPYKSRQPRPSPPLLGFSAVFDILEHWTTGPLFPLAFSTNPCYFC